MRKQLKVLLLVATVLALFAMAMIVGSATETEVGTGPALVDAVANATDEDIIKLTADVTLDAPLAINRSITIDGQGNTITLAESVTTGQIFDISAKAFTIQNVTVDADGLVNTGSASVAYLFKLSGEVKFMAENVISEFKCFLFTPAVAGAKVDFKGCTLTYIGNYQVVRYGKALGPASITFDDCKITAMTVDTAVFKAETTTVTFNDCDIDTNGTVHFSDSTAVNLIVTGAETDIKAAYLASFKPKAAASVTIGTNGSNDNIQIECSAAIVRFNRTGAYGPFTFNAYSGTLTATEGAAVFTSIATATTTVNLKGVTIVGSLFGADSTTGIVTLENCTVREETGVNLAAYDLSTLIASNIVVVPASLIVNNKAMIDYKSFAGKVVLAPAGTMVTATQANDTYVQAVTYGGNSYKMYVADAGDFENAAAAGASVRQDLNGLMFATEIAKEDVEAILAANSVTLADLRFYTLIAPMDYVAKANGVFTKDALDATDIAGVKYVEILAQN
ncbi:MAG: hypothetical protein IJF45_05910, partial [Clostridia bacterium]|nr:hypothetical protein [Clostridia bacterium]